MILNEIGEGRWLTPDRLGGDISNPQSLNRYAYALNNPATLTDPSGLGPSGLGGGIGECPFIWCQPDCSDFFSSGTCEPPFPPTEPISPPVGFPIGGGGGSSGSSGGAPTVAANPPAASPTGPFNGPSIGQPPGFVSTAQVIEQMGIYASPWEIDVLSVCAFTPVCRAVLLGAAAGALVYKGVQVYQSRRIAPNQAENAQVDRVAREFCVDRRALGKAVHDYKKHYGNFPLTQQEVEALARALPKLPGCTPTKE